MMQEPPDILIHENVLGFPREKMAELLGAGFGGLTCKAKI